MGVEIKMKDECRKRRGNLDTFCISKMADKHTNLSSIRPPKKKNAFTFTSPADTQMKLLTTST